jgi:hypothetical protein
MVEAGLPIGKETLPAVALYAASMCTRQLDKVMLSSDVHVLGTLNRNG